MKKTTIKIDMNRNTACLILAALTSMVGYNIHNSIFWSILDFLFWPVAWAKWLICHEVTSTILKETFNFLGQ